MATFKRNHRKGQGNQLGGTIAKVFFLSIVLLLLFALIYQRFRSVPVSESVNSSSHSWASMLPFYPGGEVFQNEYLSFCYDDRSTALIWLAVPMNSWRMNLFLKDSIPFETPKVDTAVLPKLISEIPERKASFNPVFSIWLALKKMELSAWLYTSYLEQNLTHKQIVQFSRAIDSIIQGFSRSKEEESILFLPEYNADLTWKRLYFSIMRTENTPHSCVCFAISLNNADSCDIVKVPCQEVNVAELRACN
jgi:hypothetical protein